jgi:hypothetical protein
MKFGKPISELSAREMRDRARDYRMLAKGAKMRETRDTYLRVAERLEARADELDEK